MTVKTKQSDSIYILFFNLIPSKLNTLGPTFLQLLDSVPEVTFFEAHFHLVNSETLKLTMKNESKESPSTAFDLDMISIAVFPSNETILLPLEFIFYSCLRTLLSADIR